MQKVLNHLQELANLLGGAIGASRGACDADYCDYSLQIGQTGKVVTPDLYIAARYFWCNPAYGRNVELESHCCDQQRSRSEIFKVADYGIVGDYSKSFQ